MRLEFDQMNDLTPQPTTIRGELLEFRTFANHWGPGKVAIPGQGTVRVVGKLLGCRAGDTVELQGTWSEDPKWGRQFKIKKATALTPVGSVGAIKWMASNFPNLGEARAREMVQAFPDNLWKILDESPGELIVINGITTERARAIGERYQECKHERETMVALRGWGLTDHQVAQCRKKWPRLVDVVKALQDNPYQLSEVVDGFGFLKTDAIAKAMGVELDAPARIAAGIAHKLSEGRGHGHCFVPAGKLQGMAARLLGVTRREVAREMAMARKRGGIVYRGDEGEFARVYSVGLEQAERACADQVLALLGRAA